MANYCGKCGSKLDETTGLCPNCDAAKIKQHYDKTTEDKTPVRKEDKIDKRTKKKALKARKKAVKREKRANWSTGKKVRRFFLKLILTVILLVVLAAGITGALVYFDVVDIPVAEQIITHLGFGADKPTDDLYFQSLSNGFTDRKITDKESALEALEDVADVIGIENVKEEFVTCEENMISDNTYYRFQQEYNGIPVYGRSITVVVDKSGNSLSLSGNYLNKRSLSSRTSPEIDETSVVEAVKQYYGDDVTIRNEGLTFYSFNECDFELAWKIYVGEYGISKYCFVSAISGKVIAELPLVYTEQTLCSGLDVDGKEQNFYAEYENGNYFMEDKERDIRVYDANNSTLQIEFLIMDSNNKLYHSDGTNFLDENDNIVYISGENFSYVITDQQGNVIGTDGESVAKLWTDNVFTEVEPVISNSETWDNNKAVTLMSRLSMIYEFWQSEFQRNSFDGGYGAIIAVYDDYKNVGWFIGDTQNAASFGSPDIPITILSFGTNNSLSMDIISHEFMHSVERSISAMNYEAESGALMEAYSDIFGEIVEDWSNDGKLNGNCDWIHNGSRNMIAPNEGSSALPDTYHGDYWIDTDDKTDKNDHGGVHTNNAVISHAAYLMWNGIDGSDSFEALDTKDIAHLFYETLYTLPSNCTFAQFRTLLQNTADIMYSQGRLSEKQCLCVSNAMFQVGIVSTATPVVKDSLSIEVHDVKNQIYDDYMLYVQYENSEEKYDGTYISEHGLTFTKPGEYQLRIVDNANTDNETVIAVAAVENGGVENLPIFTQCGVSKPDGSLGFNEERNVFERYLIAAAKTTETGSWSEQLTLEADMSISYDRGTTKTKMTLNSISDVSNYLKDDLSQIEISSITEMKVMGQTYAWSTEYKDGIAHHEYSEPEQHSQSIEIDPNIYVFDTISQESVLEEEISGNQIRFIVDGEKIAETGVAAVQQINGISDLEYGDVEMIVILSDSGSIDYIEMKFDASIEYQGYDADVSYRIYYSFM